MREAASKNTLKKEEKVKKYLKRRQTDIKRPNKEKAHKTEVKK